MIHLMIADDHAIVREGLKKLFTIVDDICVVDEATNGGSALERLRETKVDLLLLDMSMPGISGETLVVHLRAHHPTLPILILSMHDVPQLAMRALKAGANGYITKDRDPETLFAAIRKVASGGRYIDPQLAEQMVFTASGMVQQAGHDCLTDREFQVLRFLSQGAGVTQIAGKLAISKKTVSTHKARLMEKMGFTTNADLVRYAIENNLAE